jgi:hypothetical protein
MKDRTPHHRYPMGTSSIDAHLLGDEDLILIRETGTVSRAESATGRVRWTYRDAGASDDTRMSVLVIGDRIFVHAPRGRKEALLAVDARDGRLLWEVDATGFGLTLSQHGLRGISAKSGDLVAFDAETGASRVLARRKGATLLGRQAAETGVLLAYAQWPTSKGVSRIVGIDATTGKELFETSIPEPRVDIVTAVDRTVVLLGDEPTYVLLLDLRSGSVRKLDLPEERRLFIGVGDALFLQNEDSELELVRLRLPSARLEKLPSADRGVEVGRVGNEIVTWRPYVGLEGRPGEKSKAAWSVQCGESSFRLKGSWLTVVHGGSDSILRFDLSKPAPKRPETTEVPEESSTGSGASIQSFERDNLAVKPKGGFRRVPLCWIGSDLVYFTDTLRIGPKGAPWVPSSPKLGASLKAEARVAPGGKVLGVLEPSRLTLVRTGKARSEEAAGTRLLAISPDGSAALLDTGVFIAASKRIVPLPGVQALSSAEFVDEKTLFFRASGGLYRARAPWGSVEKLGPAKGVLISGDPGKLFLSSREEDRLTLFRLDPRSGKIATLFETESSGDIASCDPAGRRFAVLRTPCEVTVHADDGTLVGRGESEHELEAPGVWSSDSVTFWSESGLARFHVPSS